MAGGNPAVYFNELEKYFMHVLIPQKTVTGDPEPRIVTDKYKDKNNFLLNNTLGDVK